ncbi:UDP-N-acetylmuramoyl-L-alanyl-D-glutamate--2,6-diaminopimelate ligase [Rheinheimera marina]|uniref:UDP-N-acetylmuramoyl-L-alanyl-D-glutamate--2,6-diaminopimelate ligase n=1 Tax=Rheinheimera marina TaxID=1774958 RepID=A0ABV9JPB9_9GAMM
MQVNTAASWLTAFGLELPQTLAQQPLADLRVSSKEVVAGDVFLALPGTKTHGNDFIPQALAQGAALVLTNQPAAVDDARVLVWPALMSQLTALIEAYYPHPQLQLVGVTGTNGKSSTAIFINQLMQLLGGQAGVIGTLGYGHYQQLTPLNNTTPHLADLHRILALSSEQGRQLMALEVSSHALDQQRVAGLNFEVAVFTNLTRDHLDYHGTMQAYGAAKARLFTPQLSRRAVINVSDAFGQELARSTSLPVLVYGRLDDCQQSAEYLAYDELAITQRGYQFVLHSRLGGAATAQLVQLQVLGEFNIQNALAAAATMVQLGHPLPAVLRALSQLVSVPGRIEQFYQASTQVMAVVDYAHTPDALEQTLLACRNHTQGQLWAVFGCGGDRDKGKRPLMGAIAERLADQLVITADNPRTEDVLAICADIAAGCSSGKYQIVADRKTAITQSLKAAKAGDLVLIAGKGHEDYQIIGTSVIPYDERAFVQQLVTEPSL